MRTPPVAMKKLMCCTVSPIVQYCVKFTLARKPMFAELGIVNDIACAFCNKYLDHDGRQHELLVPHISVFYPPAYSAVGISAPATVIWEM